MTRILSGALLVGTVLAMSGCDRTTRDAPRLVVLVAVDQLTPAQLERYDPVFTGGFQRLLSEGMVFTQAVHDHALTATAPGHTTLGTGVHPFRHGIVGNDWRTEVDGSWRTVYSYEDSSATIVGAEGRPGRSPRNLLRDGLADWLLQADPDARVVSVAGKDRSAIGLAARAKGEVYWWDDALGRFVTSVYYRDAEPDWVRRFNEEIYATYATDLCWQSRAPAAAAALAYPDPAADEGGFRYCAASDDSAAITAWITRTPHVDAATVDLAIAAVREHDLGRREGGPDFLSVSLSQSDRIGHRYGPYSPEQLDNLLNVDRQLGRLLEFLDSHVGQGRYVLALSSDHGVLDLPESLQAQGVEARRVGGPMNAAVAQIRREIAESPEPLPVEYVKEQLESLDFIEQVITRAEMAGTEPADSFTEFYRRSYYQGRETARLVEFDFEIRTSPNVVTQSNQAHHGSPYYYDRHVPVIFFGAVVPGGRSDVRARTVDVAPTLAALAGIPAPDDLDGRPLLAH